MTCPILRPEELSVADALCRALGAEARKGEDPPDIYLTINGLDVAVEITALAQYVGHQKGVRPRLSSDMPAIRLANELNDDPSLNIPDGSRFVLLLKTPMVNLKKTRSALKVFLLGLIEKANPERSEYDEVIEGNKLGVILYRDAKPGTKKISAVVSSNGVGYDATEVTKEMLARAITAKAKSCSKILEVQPVWLALISDYFFADAHNCRYAFNQLYQQQPFDRIFLVSDHGEIDTIYRRAD